MQPSTTLSENASAGFAAADALLQWVGGSPLIRLSRSGEGRVLLKHEGFNPSGSFFDRVAQRIVAAGGDRFVVDGADAFALALTVVARRSGASVRVLSHGPSSARLDVLLRRFGADVVSVAADAAGEAVSALAADGYVAVSRIQKRATVEALIDVAKEVAASGVTPSLWVLPDYGIPPDVLRDALSVHGATPYLELIADDGETRRTLSGPDACRRSQTGQREGILLSPLGAEIVEAAVNAAPEVEGDVVALLPEGGQRYLGWW